MTNRVTVMICIVFATLVSSMDTTIANTTMPIIVNEIGGNEWFAWAFTSYMVLSTVVAPVAGRVSDLFGRKNILAAGIVIFLIGSVLCGFSQSMLQLVLFRALQGIGAGIMMPFPTIIAGDLYAVEERGKVQALFTGMWGLSAVLAPLLGTFFVTYMSWRWIFFINVPICIIALLTLQPYKEAYQAKKSSIDYAGALLFACGISLLLLTTAVERGIILYGVAGLLVMLVFYMFEKRQAAPIVPLHLLRNKPVATMIASSFLSCAALFGTSSYIPLFLQKEGYSLFVSGIALLGTSIGWMAVAVPGGKWVVRFGYKRLLVIGNMTLVAAGALLFFMGQGSPFWYVFIAMTILGCAYGMIFTISTIGSQQLVAAHEKGISTSLQLFARNIGTAVSVTIMGALLARSTEFYHGVHLMFVFGMVASIAALAVPFAIRAPLPEKAR